MFIIVLSFSPVSQLVQQQGQIITLLTALIQNQQPIPVPLQQPPISPSRWPIPTSLQQLPVTSSKQHILASLQKTVVHQPLPAAAIHNFSAAVTHPAQQPSFTVARVGMCLPNVSL